MKACQGIWLGVQDLVQRLESITIHWTRQIKEVVNQQVHTLSHSQDASSIVLEPAVFSGVCLERDCGSQTA